MFWWLIDSLQIFFGFIVCCHWKSKDKNGTTNALKYILVKVSMFMCLLEKKKE